MSKLLPLCIVLLAASTALSAQTYTVLHNFRNLSGEPNPDFFGRIAQSRGGAMLTTSRDAYQDYLLGKAFRVWTDGTLQVLHHFDPVFGNEPESGFTLAVDGQYYGTTVSGGAFGYGTIFKMSQNGTVTKLYDFTGGPCIGQAENAPQLLPRKSRTGRSCRRDPVGSMRAEAT